MSDEKEIKDIVKKMNKEKDIKEIIKLAQKICRVEEVNVLYKKMLNKVYELLSYNDDEYGKIALGSATLFLKNEYGVTQDNVDITILSSDSKLNLDHKLEMFEKIKEELKDVCEIVNSEDQKRIFFFKIKDQEKLNKRIIKELLPDYEGEIEYNDEYLITKKQFLFIEKTEKFTINEFMKKKGGIKYAR